MFILFSKLSNSNDSKETVFIIKPVLFSIKFTILIEISFNILVQISLIS